VRQHFRLGDTAHVPVGNTGRTDLPVFDEFAERAEDFGDGDARVVAMEQVKIDMIGLEAPEALLDIVPERSGVASTVMHVVERRVAALGADPDAVALAAKGQPFADDGFGSSALAGDPV